MPPSPPTAPARQPLRVYRFQRDGDVLVWDPAHPGEGFVQFFSVTRGEVRKFVRDAVRPQLTRVEADADREQAITAYAAWRAMQPAVASRPAVRSGTVRAVATGPARGHAGERVTSDGYEPRRPRPTQERTESQELQALTTLVARDSSRPVFVTGRAGTGKSTALRAIARVHEGHAAVLAPTGLAALNAGGQTIHRFFRFPVTALDELAIRPGQWMAAARALRVLIVDEVSMVRADLLDAMDLALRQARGTNRAFGGVRVVLFGDPYQLPPIVSREQEESFGALGYASPHFFSARVLRATPLQPLEFNTVYRQRDPEWIALLDRVRTAEVTPQDLSVLRQRVRPIDLGELDETIVLTAYRRTADTLNERRLAALDDAPTSFRATRHGTFLRESWERTDPAPDPLVLKRGARVMFVKNDPDDAWVNGSLGEVEAIRGRDEHAEVRVRLDDGSRVTVTPQEWVQHEYEVGDDDRLEARAVGRYRQLPLQLAWAVTIHKSQGLTFDHVHVDLGRGAFAPGQAYVALSRCRTLEGVTLQQPLQAGDVQADPSVRAFFASLGR